MLSNGNEIDYHTRLWCQVPLENQRYPATTSLVRDLAWTDEQIMALSPEFIAHSLIASASGGMQVVTPSLVSSSSLATRVNEDMILPDMMHVGVAAQDVPWPTLDDADLGYMVPGEPLTKVGTELAARSKTVTKGLLTGAHELRSPFAKALVKCKALIDMQRLPEVAGDADALMDLFCSVWGVGHDIFDMFQGSLVVSESDLLRYAIRENSQFPMVCAPAHHMEVIVAASGGGTRGLYGSTAAINWRVARVAAETKYYLTLRNEHRDLSKSRVRVLPGTPGVDPAEPGTLQYRPRYGAVWSVAPATFAVFVRDRPVRSARMLIPKGAMQELAEVVREMRYEVMVAGSGALGRSTYGGSSLEPDITTGDEALTSAYHDAVHSITAMDLSARTGDRVLRAAMYNIVESMPLASRMKFARCIRTLARSGESITEDVIRSAAGQLVAVAENIRVQVSRAAEARRIPVDDWWSDVSSNVPEWIRTIGSTSFGWMCAAVHLAANPQSERWEKLADAMALAAASEARDFSVLRGTLSSRYGTPERVIAICREVIHAKRRVWAAAYDGTSLALRALAQAPGSPFPLRRAYTQASYMWALRSRIIATMSVRGYGGKKISGHIQKRVAGTETETMIAPYRPYVAWLRGAAKAGLAKDGTKALPKEPPKANVLGIFRNPRLMLVSSASKTAAERSRASRLLRYVINPATLADDVQQDMLDVVEEYDRAVEALLYEPRSHPMQVLAFPDASQPPGESAAPPVAAMDSFAERLRELADRRDVWYWIGKLGEEEAEEIENFVLDLEDDVADDLLTENFPTEADFRNAIAMVREMVSTEETKEEAL